MLFYKKALSVPYPYVYWYIREHRENKMITAIIIATLTSITTITAATMYVNGVI